MIQIIHQKLMKQKINILIRAGLEDNKMSMSELRKKIGMDLATMDNRLYKPSTNHWTILELVQISEVLKIDLNNLKNK